MKKYFLTLAIIASLFYQPMSVFSRTIQERGFVSRMQNPSFLDLVTLNLVPGYSFINKFGANPLITTATDPEDVWECGGEYTFDANGTAPIVSLISSNSGDKQEISIEGLDINGNYTHQHKFLNGTTRVALTTPLWRVFRAENDGTTDLAGDVFIYTGTGTVSTCTSAVRATISDGNNQTLMTIYTIPRGKVGFLFSGEAGIVSKTLPSSNQDYAIGSYRARTYGMVFKIKKQVGLSITGTSIFQDANVFHGVIPALTDLKMHVSLVTNDIQVWGTFGILIVDESEFSTAYLTAIGQPGY